MAIKKSYLQKFLKVPSSKAWVERYYILLIEGGGVQELKWRSRIILFFWFKRVPDWGPEQRESNLTVLCLLIIKILISYIIIYYY